MARRIIAQRALTGEILGWDLQLAAGSATRELSGPGGIRGNVSPRTRTLLGPDGLPLIAEWSTALYVEEDGWFHGGGLVTRITENTDGSLAVEAPGFSTYPHGIIHGDTYQADVLDDALDVYRHLWTYVQSFPDSDLGITVDDLDSGVQVATQQDVTVQDGTVGAGFTGYKIPWWEFRDCGQEMDNLLEQARADFIEHHAWNADRTAIDHHIELGVPRLGKKRDDLRFVEGENVIAALPLLIEGDDFAQNIYGAGRGQGRKMASFRVANRDGRIRRTAIVTDKHARGDRLEKLVRREYQRRNDTRSFDTVVVQDHKNARVTSIDPGDDILVEANLTWYGRVRQWVRVISVEANLDDETAALHVARSDMFRS